MIFCIGTSAYLALYTPKSLDGPQSSFYDYDDRLRKKVSHSSETNAISAQTSGASKTVGAAGAVWPDGRERPPSRLLCRVCTSHIRRQLTLSVGHSRVKVRVMSVSKLQIGQLW